MDKRKAVAFTAFAVFVNLLVIISLFFLTIPVVAESSPLGKGIKKQFVYDLPAAAPPNPPVVGLDVSLYDGALIAIDSGVTDAFGYVEFVGLTDQTYTIKWMWGGAEKSETVEVTSDKLVFELTNSLQPKSG